MEHSKKWDFRNILQISQKISHMDLESKNDVTYKNKFMYIFFAIIKQINEIINSSEKALVIFLMFQ